MRPETDEVTASGVGALVVGDLGVVFQPIVEVATGRVFAHEALVRCKKPEYVSPPVLFEHAVAEGACGRLGRLIRDVAFGTSGDVPLFINVHPEELTARWLVRTDDPICFHQQPVFIEVTESATFTHFDLCINVLKELCARSSAKLVIDDFGAGYSNLERLVLLEPAVVKLDLAITRGVHENKRRQIVVRHMVNLCRELGATVVAEGVETVDELRCVRDLGVDYAQGYLLARPAAPPPVPDWPASVPVAIPSRGTRSLYPPDARVAVRGSLPPPDGKPPRR
jgi:EAL domain-containing protein (putative c-di-GMP-specific phosphodiesterase class I)